MIEMSEKEKIVLDTIQQDIPLVKYPFREIARRGDMESSEYLMILESLVKRNYIREISAIYNARALGYKSSLVALSSPEPDRTADVISTHHGVSHNYYREHHFNIWFTLTIPEKKDFHTEILNLLRDEPYTSYRLLPSLKTYKLGVNFRHSAKKTEAPLPQKEDQDVTGTVDRDLVRALQQPFPLAENPWKQIALTLDRSEESLMKGIETLKQTGAIKRISAVIRHRKTGFPFNGLACFRLPPEQLDQAGNRAAGFSQVSHCYNRPTYPDWPYPLLAMTHGHSEQECRETIAAIAREIGSEETLILFSTKEYKKERVRYFLLE